MPYLFCQSCRLTVYEARMFAMLATNCPRCSGQLERKPASFFKKRSESGAGLRSAVRESVGKRLPPPLDRTSESAKPLPEAPG